MMLEAEKSVCACVVTGSGPGRVATAIGTVSFVLCTNSAMSGIVGPNSLLDVVEVSQVPKRKTFLIKKLRFAYMFFA